MFSGISFGLDVMVFCVYTVLSGKKFIVVDVIVNILYCICTSITRFNLKSCLLFSTVFRFLFASIPRRNQRKKKKTTNSHIHFVQTFCELLDFLFLHFTCVRFRFPFKRNQISVRSTFECLINKSRNKTHIGWLCEIQTQTHDCDCDCVLCIC